MFNRSNKKNREPNYFEDFFSRVFGTFDDFFERDFLFRDSFESEWTSEMKEKLAKEGRVYWGISSVVGSDGIPQTKYWGNVAPPGALLNRPGRILSLPTDESQDQTREPVVDVIEEENQIRAIVELPGVTKENISLKGFENGLKLEAKNDQYNYSKWIELNNKIDEKTIKTSFNNGVLEIRANLTGNGKDNNGFEIKIN